jgi:hypothetical protein
MLIPNFFKYLAIIIMIVGCIHMPDVSVRTNPYFYGFVISGLLFFFNIAFPKVFVRIYFKIAPKRFSNLSYYKLKKMGVEDVIDGKIKWLFD